MTKPWIYVDFNKRLGADTHRLTTLGTHNDLQRQGLTLRPGFAFVAYMEERLRMVRRATWRRMQ